jgi:type VI secretion system secreted protein Hcp
MSVDFFIKVDAIKGEAKDKGHVDEIKIHSWSWGASQVTSVSGSGGSGAGKASLAEISIMKDYDMASPKLFEALLKGTHIKTVDLTAQKATGADSGTPFLIIKLTECYCTSQQVSGSSEIPSESISFSYKSIDIDYKKQSAAGTLETAAQTKYDVTTNTVG